MGPCSSAWLDGQQTVTWQYRQSISYCICRQKRSVNSSSIALLPVKFGPDGEPPPLLPGNTSESSAGKPHTLSRHNHNGHPLFLF